jgi:energy-coupling factor transporter ATP-binding protein EcfA2
MILHRIHIEGWGCFANPTEIGPFDERLTIFGGPNGTGKSTLLKIITRGLVDTYSVGGTEAQGLRPWGCSLTPKVMIEFAHGGLEYRLNKRFLDKPAALLEMCDGAGWTRVAEDEAADRRVRELLRAEAPGAGLSNSKHWGIMQVLLSPQDVTALPALSGDVLADIHASLGVQISGPEGIRMEGNVESLYRQFYTPTGRLRSGAGEPPVARLRRARAEAEEIVQRGRQDLSELETRRERIAALQERYRALCSTADRVIEDLEERRLQLSQYEGLLLDKNAREQGKRAAEAEHGRIKQQVKAIQECIAAITEAKRELSIIDLELPISRAVVISEERAHLTAAANMKTAQANHAAAWDAAARAAEARRFVNLRDILANLLQKLEGVELADLEINRCRTALSAVRAPSQQQVMEIRAAVKVRDDAQIRLESSLIVLELEPISDASIQVVSGDHTGEQTVSARSSARISGSPIVEVEILGFGRIRASGPVGSAAEYRRQLEQAEARFYSLVEPFGGADLDHLEDLLTHATELERKMESARNRLDAHLMKKSVADLHAERGQVESEIAEIERQQSSWATDRPDVAAIEETARKLQQASELELRAAQETLGAVQQALNDARVHTSELTDRLARRLAEIQEWNRRLENLRADGMSDTQRYQELERAALEWDGQKLALEKLLLAMAPYPSNLVTAVQTLEAQAARATQERDLARDHVRDEEARVRYLAAAAPYSAVGEAEERLEAISVELRGEELRAEAARLLHDTLDACRSEAVASIPERVVETAVSILRRIAGPSFQTVSLTEGLTPSAASPMSVGSAVPLADLSGGEKEQIAFAVRLALARELARSERQLLVLDDSLTTTDPARFERILDILRESADQLQIVILTCDPRRYEALAEATRHNLDRVIGERTTRRAA